MASLNDIESQLDTIITDLSGGISSSTIFDVVVDGGAYTLANDKTFDDIKSELSAGKMPIIRWNDSDDSGDIFYFMPSVIATDSESHKLLSWYLVRYAIINDEPGIKITSIRENRETTNKFISWVLDLQ